jgi:hypothetical protein
MTRYWNDELYHSQAYSGSGSGHTRKNHKYIYKEYVNGKWRYYYQEDLNALSKTGTHVQNVFNNLSSGTTAAQRESDLKKSVTQYVNNVKNNENLSDDGAQMLKDTLYGIGKNLYSDTDNKASFIAFRDNVGNAVETANNTASAMAKQYRQLGDYARRVNKYNARIKARKAAAQLSKKNNTKK